MSCCDPQKDRESRPLLKKAAIDCCGGTRNEVLDEDEEYVDDLTQDFLEPKGLLLLMWADVKGSSTSGFIRRFLEFFNILLVIGVSVGVPLLLVLQKVHVGNREYLSTHFCKGADGDTYQSKKLAGAATLLFMYLYVMQSRHFCMPRAYAYLLAINGQTFSNITKSNFSLHLAVFTAEASNVFIFVGTYFLFIRNQTVSDLVLNCIALTFCIEASNTIASTRRNLGPMGKAATRASRRLDRMMEAAKGSQLHAEWNMALYNEPMWKSILLWPLDVPTTGSMDYVWCCVSNLVRLLGLCIAYFAVPYCLGAFRS